MENTKTKYAVHIVQVITVVKGARAWICCRAADMFPELPCTSWLNQQNEAQKSTVYLSH